MSKDKQIEEMAKVIKSSLDGLGSENFNFTGDEISTMFAEALYNAGYRKASDVAREIFEEIDKIVDKHYNNHIFGNNDLDDLEHDAIINFSDDVIYDIDKLKKKYTEGRK